jgi:thymidine kinase
MRFDFRHKADSGVDSKGDAPMAKLYFRYGAMNSSKTANALMVKFNYEERHQRVLLMKPAVDVRDGIGIVTSRAGLTSPCLLVERDGSIIEVLLRHMGSEPLHCLIVDEAQFLTKSQVMELTRIVDDLKIPVICYGLRADFIGNLFEGSQWLLSFADTIEEVKTICWCGRKAIMNARLLDGRVVKEGEQIVLGGNDRYLSLCRHHWSTGETGPACQE